MLWNSCSLGPNCPILGPGAWEPALQLRRPVVVRTGLPGQLVDPVQVRTYIVLRRGMEAALQAAVTCMHG
jgi:hypothetical protein